MPSKPRSSLFDDFQRRGQGGCHFTGVAPPQSCLAASTGFSPKAEIRKSTPLRSEARCGLHPLQRQEWRLGQLDNDAVTGTHTPASQHDGHYAGFSDQLALWPSAEHRRQQSLLPVIDLGTGIAKAGDFQNHFLADLKVRSSRETKRIYLLGRDVLAQISRPDPKTVLCNFVEQFGVDDVHLAKIGLCWISLDPRTMLNCHALVCVSFYPDPCNNRDFGHDLL